MNEKHLKEQFQKLAKSADGDVSITAAIMARVDAGESPVPGQPGGFWKFWLTGLLEYAAQAAVVLVLCLAVGWCLQALLPEAGRLDSLHFPALDEATLSDSDGASLQPMSVSVSFFEVLARGIFPISIYLLGFGLLIYAVAMEIPGKILDDEKEKVLC